MILSVSRRTDIPAFYSNWFINRIREGEVYVRNPFNYNQISSIPLKPDNVDCIIFWTKNANPIMKYLDELDLLGYKYYFQYTITSYNEDLEPFYKNKKSIINNFIDLSKKIGKEKVILRYDPIVLTSRYTKEYHIKAFEKLCSIVGEYTNRVVFSFVDDYRKVSRNMKGIDSTHIDEMDMREIAKEFFDVAKRYNLEIQTCAEKIDLEDLGINHAKCIDGELIENILGIKLVEGIKKDNNRENCGCLKCIDIGEYDTCIHNCSYCYANLNKNRALDRYKSHDENSKILVGDYDESKVKERNKNDIRSVKKIQNTFFD